jgi:hypothetical protein
MVRKKTACVGCCVIAAVPGIPIVLLAIFNIVTSYTPVADPLFNNRPLVHWLSQVDSDIPAERLEASKILADIVLHGASMPMSCHPLGGLVPSFRRDVRIAEHRHEFIGRHVLQIFAALESIACADDPPNNLEAMLALSQVGRWCGEDEQLQVLPILIAACNDRNPELRKAAIENLMNALSNFHGYDSYNNLPIAKLRPLIVSALDDEQLRSEAMNISGMMGTRAGPDVVDALLRLKQEHTNEPPGFHSQLDWALRRAQGEQ